MFDGFVLRCWEASQELLRRRGIRISLQVHLHAKRALMAYRAGHVYVPRWQGLRSRNALVRAFLHESGHAVFEVCRTRILRSRGRDVFGDFDKPYPSETECIYWRTIGLGSAGYVSGYARAHPLEDFCETFVVFVLGEMCTPKTQFIERVLRV